jgi:hypothetical protein
MHKIGARCESLGEYHLLDDLVKDEERFWRYFRMSSGTFNYILELLRTLITKKNTNFRSSISPEERFMVKLK